MLLQYPDKAIYFYNGETDDNIKNAHLQDVDAIWSQADVVIYTPTILTGVSFNIVDHFDYIFIYAFPDSCTIRDMWQAAGRVRNFKDKEMFYSLDTFGERKWHLPLTYNGVRAAVKKDGELNTKYSDEKEMYPADPGDAEVIDFLHCAPEEEWESDEGQAKFKEMVARARLEAKMKNTPDWLLGVHVRNKWEENLTRYPGAFRTVYLLNLVFKFSDSRQATDRFFPDSQRIQRLSDKFDSIIYNSRLDMLENTDDCPHESL